MCPHPTPVATKSLLCGPQPTHVASTASCWSSAYPCSYHNTLLVLRESGKPKAYFCGPHSLPLSPTKKQILYPHSTMCIISLPQFPQKPHLWCSANHHIISSGPQSTFVAITTTGANSILVGLSLPPSQHYMWYQPTTETTQNPPSGPQPTSEATTAPWWSSAYPIKPTCWFFAYTCIHHSILVVLRLSHSISQPPRWWSSDSFDTHHSHLMVFRLFPIGISYPGGPQTLPIV